MNNLQAAVFNHSLLHALEDVSGNEPMTVDLWWQFVFYSVAVIFVIFFAWLATRLLAERSGTAARQSRYLSVLDRMQLAPNRTLYLITFAGKVLLIGQGDRELNVLTEISEEELLHYLEENPSAGLDEQGMTFLKNLQDTLAKMKR